MKPNTYYPSTAVTLKGTFKDKDGALVDPTGNTCTVTVKLPDGTTSTPSVTRLSTGVYEATLTVTQTGTYYYQFKGTGNAETTNEEVFEVKTSRVS